MRHRPTDLRRFFLILALMGVSLGLNACLGAAPSVSYYTLDPLLVAAPAVPPAGSQMPMRVGVGPVSLPTYLQRAQIVTRSGEHMLAINDFHRWAGPLDEEIMRVLVVSVAAALPQAEVQPYPWGRRYEPSHQVQLTVQRFDGEAGAAVHLRGIWHLACPSDLSRNRGQAFDISEAVNGVEMAALVAAQNRVLATLAGEIVAALCE
jgi:uncharacterized lipoprotein YmbA